MVGGGVKEEGGVGGARGWEIPCPLTQAGVKMGPLQQVLCVDGLGQKVVDRLTRTQVGGRRSLGDGFHDDEAYGQDD